MPFRACACRVFDFFKQFRIDQKGLSLLITASIRFHFLFDKSITIARALLVTDFIKIKIKFKFKFKFKLKGLAWLTFFLILFFTLIFFLKNPSFNINIRLSNFFSFFYMRLSRFYNLHYSFDGLIQVNSCIFYHFLIFNFF
jgi:hypothetical protein